VGKGGKDFFHDNFSNKKKTKKRDGVGTVVLQERFEDQLSMGGKVNRKSTEGIR